jgi:hypothetical protein
MKQSDLLSTGDVGFSESVDIFNGARAREPLYAARPESAAEIQWVLKFARQRGLGVSVRGGGHGTSGRAIKGEVVIDLRGFRDVEVGDDFVRVGSGLTWGMLDRALSDVGLVVPGGTVSSTGVSGLTLGGGVGWLLPLYGLTADNLRAVEGVTADGELVRISDDGPLAWAMPWLRGMGHGLLVVTHLEFDRLMLPPLIAGGSVVYQLSDAVHVLSLMLAASEACPHFINWSPSFPMVKGRRVLSVDGVSFGPLGLETWLESIGAGGWSASSVQRMTYPQLQAMLDNPHRWGQRSAWRSVFSLELQDAALECLLSAVSAAPSDTCLVFLERFAGAVKQEKRPASFALRNARFNVLFIASWSSREDDERVEGWASSAAKDLRSVLGASSFEHTYVNYASDGESVATETESGYRAVVDRLDPSGLLSSSRRG